MLFDGKKFAKEKEIALKGKLEKLGRKLVLVSVLVGEDRASELYTKMKQKAAERVGIEFRVYRFDAKIGKDELKRELIRLSGDEADGVMLQLPLPGDLVESEEEILAVIPNEKDVDGLKWRSSGVMPATVRAVFAILERIANEKEYWAANLWERSFVVVGYTGNVGVPMMSFLEKRGVSVEGINSKTENAEEVLRSSCVVISCVGKPGVIRSSQVTDGVIVVDVGIEMVDGKPQGDFESSAYEKASVAVPVPGGVGPVTVVSLLENLFDLTLVG